MAKRLSRRRLLETLAGLPFMSGLASGASPAQPRTRIRPGDPTWPLEESWNQLNREVEGRLIKVRPPLADCVGGTPDANCEHLFKELKNPYYLGDEVGLTQSLGWVGAWTSEPSVYAVVAKTTQDVVAAVNFARTNNLRLVVKGGGHSYQGTSNAADSLLVWTRHMNAVGLHDAFVGAGCAGNAEPQPAVSIEPGAIWGHVYNQVMTNAGRYVDRRMKVRSWHRNSYDVFGLAGVQAARKTPEATTSPSRAASSVQFPWRTLPSRTTLLTPNDTGMSTQSRVVEHATRANLGTPKTGAARNGEQS